MKHEAWHDAPDPKRNSHTALSSQGRPQSTSDWLLHNLHCTSSMSTAHTPLSRSLGSKGCCGASQCSATAARAKPLGFRSGDHPHQRYRDVRLHCSTPGEAWRGAAAVLTLQCSGSIPVSTVITTVLPCRQGLSHKHAPRDKTGNRECIYNAVPAAAPARVRAQRVASTTGRAKQPAPIL